MPGRLIRIVPVFVVLIAGAILADEPATQAVPATEPSTQPTVPRATIRGWFSDLASPDAARREEAQVQLMGLSRDDLPTLKLVVQESRPLAPAQVAALHDIVLQVYLSGEQYETDPLHHGFLGLHWSMEEARTADSGTLGVPVEERLLGFPSFRVLRQNDLILAVLIHPDEPAQQLPNTTTPTGNILVDVVGKTVPNQEIWLEVLRQGQVIRIPIRVMPRPRLLNDEMIDVFINERVKKAEDFWKKQFDPLLRSAVD